MTVRNPLVLIPGGNPQIQELPAGDTIGGAPTGAAATIAVGSTTTGAAGTDASVVNSGTSSAAILDFTIPEGDKGDKGDQGDPGDDGVGVPAGGTAGQVLTKIDGTDYNTHWAAAGAGGMTKIASVVTTSSASTITFSSIPNSYIDLLIVITGRDTATGSNDLAVRLKINSDATSGNYTSTQYLLGQSAAATANNQAASSAGGIVCQIPGSSGNANAVGGGRILIPNYKGTVFHKIVMEDSFELHSGTPSLLKIQRAFVWKNTAAITDLVLTAGGTAFVDGTTATLYGMG